MDKISVIMPVYNVEPYVERAVWSLLLQTYDDMEIIIIDDGSTDKSGEICDEIKKKWESKSRDKRRTIIIRHIENSGQSHARNVGLSFVTGDYIGFVDGDDACNWNMYEVLINVIKDTGADMAECNFTGRKSPTPDVIEKDAMVNLTGREALIKHLTMKPSSRYPSTSVWSKLFKRKVISGLSFPDGRAHEEFSFLAHALYNSDNYVYINKKLYERTLRSDSTTAERFSVKNLDKFYVYRDRTKFLESTKDKELINLSKEQEYVLWMQLYYQCLENKMSQRIELRNNMMSERKNILASNISIKKKLQFIGLISIPGLIETVKAEKKFLNKDRIKKKIYHICSVIHRNHPVNPNVVGLTETIEKLRDSQSSLIRYGDGEFVVMRGGDISEQKADISLGKALQDVLNSNDSRIMYCICDIFGSLDEYTMHSRQFWEEHLYFHRKEYLKYCGHDRIYYDALVTRPYFMLKNKAESKVVFDGFRSIWYRKRLIIVEGGISHNGVGNDLFGEALSIRRIIVPSKSCFSVYDKILETLNQNVSDDDMILVSIGAASKLLVFNMVQNGYRAIDIGNLDMEYEWYLHNTKDKCQLLKHDIDGEELDRELGYDEYLSQIITRINSDD